MAKKQTERETLAESLKRMAQTDIRTVDKNTLVERSTVKLDPAMSREEVAEMAGDYHGSVETYRKQKR